MKELLSPRSQKGKEIAMKRFVSDVAFTPSIKQKVIEIVCIMKKINHFTKGISLKTYNKYTAIVVNTYKQ